MNTALAHLEEMIRSTEQALTALGLPESDRIRAADIAVRQSLQRAKEEEGMDPKMIEDPAEKALIYEKVQHLQNLTRLCLDKAEQRNKSLIKEFAQTKQARDFLKASQNTVPLNPPTLDRKA